MKVLIAEDDGFFRKMLEQLLAPDYEVTTVDNGILAWDVLQEADPPRLAILDCVMPGLSGPQVCRNVRSNPRTAATYLIVLTAKNSVPDIVAGLRAGADDYLTKPFHAEELRAHLRVGQRVIDLQSALERQAHVLSEALKREKLLQHLLPMCPVCKAKRIDSKYWEDLENYIRTSGISAGKCPTCSVRQADDSHSAAVAAGGRSR